MINIIMGSFFMCTIIGVIIDIILTAKDEDNIILKTLLYMLANMVILIILFMLFDIKIIL